jgi:hypothetical protein
MDCVTFTLHNVQVGKWSLRLSLRYLNVTCLLRCAGKWGGPSAVWIAVSKCPSADVQLITQRKYVYLTLLRVASVMHTWRTVYDSLAWLCQIQLKLGAFFALWVSSQAVIYVVWLGFSRIPFRLALAIRPVYVNVVNVRVC